MTYDELENKIIEVLSHPDSALVNIKPILAEAKTDYESIITLTEAKTKNEARIRDLQDTNMKLFLAQAGKKQEDEESDDEDELEGAEAIDAFVNKLNEEKGE